ncbi:MAG: fumarylacetoacetate hydrolase family protein [Cytophagaceae bacterium]|nr:fumarylacetoacetate hydrolase family protein [Cytophagaceae bacterium]
MHLYKNSSGAILQYDNFAYQLEDEWDALLVRDDLATYLKSEKDRLQPVGGAEWMALQPLDAPIGSQEIWAAGVTYQRSKLARMEESEESGGSTFYDKVYDAERPELFFKGTAHRAVGPGGKVNIRKDSTWDVPEPELTLVISPSGKIVGYTIGNDMSSRSIEGENPLYLPQAKVYDRCAGLGPGIFVTDEPLPMTTKISLEIRRAGAGVFAGDVTIDRIKRRFDELVEFLFRECSFPQGCFLMTGTGVVPGNDFTLQAGDEIRITISPIGTLVNVVN